MRWHIEGRIRATIHAFTGVNFSGQRTTTEIWPSGGRQGDDIDGSRLKCIGIIAPLGTRLVLITAAGDEGWDRLPWRALELREGSCFRSRDGHPAVQVPDLDLLDPVQALRSDPDFQVGYPSVASPEERPGWTYGRSGTIPLKCNIRQIRIDRIDRIGRVG